MKKYFTKQNIILGAILVAYFIVGAIMILHVEPWIDETNTWQIAKVLTPSNFFEVYRVEPHPILWTLIQMPFAKLGASIYVINFISLTIMTLSLFIFLKYSPIKKIPKALVVISAVFLYFSPVLARDYCLVFLGVMTIVSLFHTRFKKPIRYAFAVALLFQSHYIAVGLAIYFAIEFALGLMKKKGIKRKTLAGVILIIGASVLLDAACVVGPFMHNYLGDRISNYRAYETGSFLEFPFKYLSNANRSLFGISLPVVQVGIILFAIYLWRFYPKIFPIFCTSIVFHVIMLSYVYPSDGDTRKDVLLLLYFVLAVWLTVGQKPQKRNGWLTKMVRKSELMRLIDGIISNKEFLARSLAVLCVLTIPFTTSVIVWDLNNDAYPSKKAADYINALPDESIFITLEHHSDAIALVPMLTGGRKIYDPVENDWLSYIAYDGFQEMPSYQELLDQIAENGLFSGKNIYFIRAFAYSSKDFAAPEYAVELERFEADETTFSLIRKSQITVYQYIEP